MNERSNSRRTLALALASLPLAGCVALPTLGGLPPREGPVRESDQDLRDVRGIVHCHSKQSHDSKGEFEDIAAAATETGSAFVILTDHLKEVTDDEGPDGSIGGVLFLPGIETRADRGGSILSLGARARIDTQGTDREVMTRIRARGGLVAIAHPEEVTVGGALDDAEAVELENLHADVLDESKLGLFFRGLFLPPGAFFGSIVDRQPAAALVYDSVARTRPVAALGSCDAHEAIRPLGPLAGALDSYRRVFRVATTHVLLREVTKQAILDALRQGRSYAACELYGDATGFRFVLERAGAVVALLGGETALEHGTELVVDAPRSCELMIRKDGAPFFAAKGRAARVPVERAGSYRVEARLEDRPWVWTSAIRVVDVAPVRSGPR